MARSLLDLRVASPPRASLVVQGLFLVFALLVSVGVPLALTRVEP